MQFDFWSEWPTPLKRILFLFSSAFFLSAIYILYADLQGINNILDWQIIGQRTTIPIALHEVQLGNLTLQLLGSNSIISETYIGGPIQINQVANYSFLILLAGIITLGTTSITYLSKVWFMIMNLIFVIMLWYFQLNKLLVFGFDDTTTFILITVSYLGLSYYINKLRPDKDFVFRILAFCGLTIGWSVIIGVFSEIQHPFILLVANGFIIPFLIGLVFIMMVSHEILHLVLIAISRPGVISGNNLTRFTVFSLIYLVNITLLLLHDTNTISLNFFYLNPYVLMVISSILGLWGLQTRKELFKSVQQFPILVFMYLVMALCCFGSVFYFLGNANDPILQVIKDVIIYSHFGFGVIFFIYVISNFMGMLQANMAIEKIVYKPRNMPHFTFRFAGAMIVLGFALKENIEIPLYQTISGQYNNLGDYHMISNDFEQASEAYKEGKIYGYMNHKSNYALGKLYEVRNPSEAVEHYSNAVQARPSEMAYINLSSLWSKTGDLFNSLFILSDGQAQFQKSAAILNNKGHLLEKLNILDSAIIYYDASFRSQGIEEPITNYLGLLANNSISLDADSIRSYYNSESSMVVATNSFALQNTLDQRTLSALSVPDETVLNMYSSSFLTNYLVNQYPYLDSVFLFKQEKIASNGLNSPYEEEIRYNLAVVLYLKGHVNKAIEILENLVVQGTPDQGKFQFTLGVIRTEMMDPGLAKFHFAQSASNGFEGADLAESICSFIIGEDEDALEIWKMIANQNSTNTYLAEQLINIVSQNPFELTDNEKVSWIKLHPKASIDQIENILLSIESDKERGKVIDYVGSKYYREGKFMEASNFIKRVAGEESMMLRYARVQMNLLNGEEIKNPVTDDNKLLMLSSSNKKEDSLIFKALGSINAYNYVTIEKSIDYFRIHAHPMKPYETIVEALRINPSSVPLLKLYIEECLDQNLSSYTLFGLKSLHKLVDTEEYNDFIRDTSDELTAMFGNNDPSLNPE